MDVVPQMFSRRFFLRGVLFGETKKTYGTLSTGRSEGDVTWEKLGHRMGHWGHLKINYCIHLLYKQQDVIMR